MALPKLEKDISYISKLADLPNDVSGGALSAAELKARFDAAGVDIKEFINETFIPWLEGINGASSLGIAAIEGIDASTVQAALEVLKNEINNAAAGAIPDRSIDSIKLKEQAVTSTELADGAVNTEKLSDSSVTADKIADGAIDESKLAKGAVSAEQIADDSVTSAKLGPSAVTSGKIAAAAVGTEKIADSAVTTGKIADEAVTANKIADGAVGADKIANGAVTRVNLANDALYSPDRVKANSSNITLEDMGYTLRPAFNTSITLNLTQANSSAMPIGTEVAVIRWGGGEIDVKVYFDGVRFAITGESSFSKSKSARITEPYGMLALRKMATDNTNGDAWLVTGNVEVV